MTSPGSSQATPAPANMSQAPSQTTLAPVNTHTTYKAPMANTGEDQPGIFKLPWPVREEIYKLAFGGHVILPRPNEPALPSDVARYELGRLFGKIKNATANSALAKLSDLRTRFEDIVRCAIYGLNWNNEVERAAAQFKVNTLLAWISSCQRGHDEAIAIIYQNNIFDIGLLLQVAAADAGTNGKKDSGKYRFQPKVPAKYLQHIRAIHLSTRPLNETASNIAICPEECLNQIKHIILTCATNFAPHIPTSDVRHHIPHGRDWVTIWGEISKPGKFKSLETIEANVCGWRVPPGWRREVLAPIADAAKALGRLPSDHHKRKATTAEGQEVDQTVLDEVNTGKLIVNPKCQVKMMDIYVPWAKDMVLNHNNASAHKNGFKLIVDQDSLDQLAKKLASPNPNDRIDPGWVD